jgi:threonylcarbamoyladenosine tRNA methylthiotransferase MtaB
VASYFVQNFGCRANQSDGAVIELQLAEAGLAAARSAATADVVVLNSCTVTSAADADARHAIRRIRRENPGCRIVVTGCYAQRAAQEISAIEGVNVVIGNSHKQEIAAWVTGGPAQRASSGRGFVTLDMLQHQPGAHAVAAAAVHANGIPKIITGDIFEQTQILVAPTFAGGDKTRPNLKVQDGCDNRCSYCVIPFVRGASRSLPLGMIVAQVQALTGHGYNEVVISGINLGRWGRDLDSGLRLAHLVRAILEHTDLLRLRLSSIEPMDWDDDLIDLLSAERRIARHAHVPLQSGSDSVLRRMHRRYRPWHYREKIERIHAALPEAAIGADVMVGFPGETQDEFDETVELIESLPFTYLHVFIYSPRPGTAAADHLEADWSAVAPQIAAERSRTLRDIAARKHSDFMHCFIGQTLPVITLSQHHDGFTDALSDNYLKVRIAGNFSAGHLIDIEINSAAADCLLA